MKNAPERTPTYPDDPCDSVPAFAASINKHPKTVYKWIREGKGPAVVRISAHSIAIRRSAREKFLAERTVEPKKMTADE